MSLLNQHELLVLLLWSSIIIAHNPLLHYAPVIHCLWLQKDLQGHIESALYTSRKCKGSSISCSALPVWSRSGPTEDMCMHYVPFLSFFAGNARACSRVIIICLLEGNISSVKIPCSSQKLQIANHTKGRNRRK